MKYKKIVALFLTLLFLSLIAYQQFKIREKKFKPKRQQIPLFTNLDIGQTNKVEIITPNKRTVLERREEKWFVVTSGNYPANERLINILFRRIKSLSAGEVVTDNPQKHTTFKVDGTGIKIKLLDHGENLQAAFYVGKTDDDYVDTYLRKEGSERVLVIHDNIQQIFIPYEWRSHRIFHFQETVHLKQKEGGTWENISGKKGAMNQHNIKVFLDALSSLQAMDFVKDDIELTIPDKPKFKIQVMLEDESIRTLIVGKAEHPVIVHVWVLEEKPVFLVSRNWLDRLEEHARGIFQSSISE
jgi:hypothetical protein